MSKQQRRTQSVVIDSSIWVSSLLTEDAFHYESRRKIANYARRNILIFVPLPVVLEIITVMHRSRFSVKEIENTIRDIKARTNHKIVELDLEELIYSAIHSFPKTNLRSGDYHIILYAINFNSTFFETIDFTQKTAYNLIKSKLKP